MTTRAILVLTAIAGGAAAACAQGPGLQIRFANGTNAVTVPAGALVPVQIWTTGLPSVGAPIPWTTMPGTGQIGSYLGFGSVLMNLEADGGVWTPPTPASVAPPFFSSIWNNGGTVSGTNINGINIGVGFGSPVTGTSFLLWSGTITVGPSNVNLSTLIRPVGAPPNGPNTGIEVKLSGIAPTNVSHFFQSTNGAAVITVPEPVGLVLLGLSGLVGARRRR